MTGEILRWVGNVGLLYCAVVATFSVVLHFRVPWRETAMGRHLMAYMFVIAVVLDLAVVRVFAGDTGWFAALRLVVFVLGLPLVLTWRVALQLAAARLDRRECG